MVDIFVDYYLNDIIVIGLENAWCKHYVYGVCIKETPFTKRDKKHTHIITSSSLKKNNLFDTVKHIKKNNFNYTQTTMAHYTEGQD